MGMMRDCIEKFGHNRKVQEQILEFWMFVEKEASFVSAFSTNSLAGHLTAQKLTERQFYSSKLSMEISWRSLPTSNIILADARYGTGISLKQN